MNDITVRPATVRDVPAMARLISTFAERGRMLFRSHAELYETLRDFVVAISADGNVVGVCALEIVWADLAEVKSLAVAADYQGRGVGRKLVDAVVEEARKLEIQKVFALTYEQKFFEHLQFAVVNRNALPLKVWSDCVKCPKRDGCDEIAVVRQLFDAPILSEQNPDDIGYRYEVPTPIVQLRIQKNG